MPFYRTMKADYKNIIIRMPNWLGDAVMASPILADVRARYPDAKITVMVLQSIAPLFLGNPHVDEIFSFTRPNHLNRRLERRGLIERIRQGKYDLGILLSNSFSSAWTFWRGQVKERLGFASDFRSPLLTLKPSFPKNRTSQHLVSTYKQLLSPLGISHSETPLQLFITKKERSGAQRLLEQHHIPSGKKIIGINPGAAYGSAKCWLPERFRAVTEKLLKDPDLYILYFGDQKSSALVNSICNPHLNRVINLAGKTTLRELMSLLQQCHLLLTNDSGPMHLAAALKTPLIALFGSTNDTTTGPYQFGKVIHKHVSCSPCYKRVCPIDFRCMKQIEVDEVYNIIREELPC